MNDDTVKLLDELFSSKSRAELIQSVTGNGSNVITIMTALQRGERTVSRDVLDRFLRSKNHKIKSRAIGAMIALDPDYALERCEHLLARTTWHYDILYWIQKLGATSRWVPVIQNVVENTTDPSILLMCVYALESINTIEVSPVLRRITERNDVADDVHGYSIQSSARNSLVRLEQSIDPC